MVSTMAPWVPVLANDLNGIEQAVIRNIAQEMAVAQQQWAHLLGIDTSATNSSTNAAEPPPASSSGNSNGSSSTNVAPIASKSRGATTESDSSSRTKPRDAVNTSVQPLTATIVPNGNPGYVDGQVWLDNNGDGSEDDGEMGYSGATVNLVYQSESGPDVIMSTTTDTNGNYQFVVSTPLYNLPNQFEIQVVFPYDFQAAIQGYSQINASGYTPEFTLNPNSTVTENAGIVSMNVTTLGDAPYEPIQ